MVNITKVDDKYKWEACGLSVVFCKDEYPSEEIVEYGNKLAQYYVNNKELISEQIYNRILKDEELVGNNWCTEKYSKEQVIELLGMPEICVNSKDSAILFYLDSNLDVLIDHLFSAEVYGFNVVGISVDG